MKARSAAVQAGLAVAGLVAAYVTWQRPKDAVKSDAVVALDASRTSLERIHYDDGARAIDVEKKDRFWVTQAWLPGKRPVVDAGVPAQVVTDGGVDAGVTLATTRPAEPAPDRALHANDRADTLWAKFTPLEATRALGVLPKEKLDELGLTGSERKLVLKVAGAEHRFTISKPMSGIIGSYAQNEKGEVFLLASSLFNDLDPHSAALVDRRLHTFKQSEVDAFTVKADGKEAAFVQSGADIPQTAKVARAATPDKADELAKNWHEKIWNRLVVTEVLGKGELPKPGEPKVKLRIDYSSRGNPKGWLELGMDPTDGMWARTENTASWVAIHQGAEETVAEGVRLLSQ